MCALLIGRVGWVFLEPSQRRRWIDLERHARLAERERVGALFGTRSFDAMVSKLLSSNILVGAATFSNKRGSVAWVIACENS
jgi:hypothetical protein